MRSKINYVYILNVCYYKKKKVTQHRQNRLVAAKGRGLGEEWIERLGVADISFYR